MNVFDNSYYLKSYSSRLLTLQFPRVFDNNRANVCDSGNAKSQIWQCINIQFLDLILTVSAPFQVLKQLLTGSSFTMTCVDIQSWNYNGAASALGHPGT